MKTQQRGISLPIFLAGALVFIIVVIFGLKMIPAYMQDAKITNLFNAIKHDPDMSRANLAEMRASFARRASIDTVTAITPDQIELADGGILTARYDVKIPVAGNVSLLLEFNPRSGQ